ncbi:MAG: bifunctional nuclease family protein, partial [Chlamydiota bacterium]|nr:bifunctional nuclease family protein [Chlamydiota bacterium]
QYVLILETIEEDARLVPIWIGASEGSSIALHMQSTQLPRPITHDLIVNMLKLFDATIKKIIISDLKDNTYYAIIEANYDKKLHQIDARPSDAVAIGVRCNATLYIDEKVLEKCPKIERPISEQDIEKFRSDMQNLSPEEFFRRLEQKE